MIIETQVHTCRKCHGKVLIKNGENTCGNQQYHCKTCGAYGVLEPHERFTEEEKNPIIKAYQERSSMRGKEKAEQLPPLDATLIPVDPEQTAVLELDEPCSFVFKKQQSIGLGFLEQSDPRSRRLCVW